MALGEAVAWLGQVQAGEAGSQPGTMGWEEHWAPGATTEWAKQNESMEPCEWTSRKETAGLQSKEIKNLSW